MSGDLKLNRDGGQLHDILLKRPAWLPDWDLPKVTVAVLTSNSAATVGLTLESLLSQDYPSLEIFVVDALSEDKTVEVVRGFRSEKIKILAVSHYQFSEMCNRVILAGNGDYFNFLTPGTTYLSSWSLKEIMSLTASSRTPLLVYANYLVREADGKTDLGSYPFSKELMMQGIAPTSFEACWISAEAFQKIGLLSPKFNLRSGFEWLCRLVKSGEKAVVSSTLVVSDLPPVPHSKLDLWKMSIETGRAIRSHFGLKMVFRLILIRLEISLFWLRRLVFLFSG